MLENILEKNKRRLKAPKHMKGSEESENKKLIALKRKPLWKQYLWQIPLMAIMLVLLFIAMHHFLGNEVIPTIDEKNGQIVISTFIIWIGAYLFFKGITNKSFLSFSIVICIETIFDMLNYIVRVVRGSAITISDIVAIRTALSVSSQVHFQFSQRFFWGLRLILLIIAILIIFRKKFIVRKDTWIERGIKVLVGIIVFATFLSSSKYDNRSLWNINNTYRELGSPLTIIRMLRDFHVSPPEGYNKNNAKATLQEYAKKGNNVNESNTDSANIIAIVNESYCDYYNLYKDGYKDPIKYLTDLSKGENVISGTMYSSEYGGQTSNVEYEFLTQNSMRILPIGSYVFQQYIPRPVNSSIVKTLKEQGYKTSGMHPWEKYSYSRSKIYRFFGFDTVKFKNDIEGLEPNFNSEFPSDRSTYKELIKQLKAKDKNEKTFNYVLTVQNHVGYLNADPNQEQYHDEPSKNIYMQLLHESTDALEELIDELKKMDEKYILLFFGDHQPNLDGLENSEERSLEKYEIPFIIWANYDIEEQYNVKTSTIFLQNYLLKAANAKFSDMNNYMEELQKYYPVITKRFYMDTAGNVFKNGNNSLENSSKIDEYNKIDYYQIFDNK